MSTSKTIIQKSTEHESSQSSNHDSSVDIIELKKSLERYQQISSRTPRRIIHNNTKKKKFYRSDDEIVLTYIGNYPYSILQFKKEIDFIKNEIEQIKELLALSYTASAKEDENMYEPKEIMEKLDKTDEKVYNLEKSVAVIEERTKKLDQLDKIQETLNDLRADIPKGGEIATKDFVGKKVNHAIIWIIVTAIGTGISLFRLFTM